MQLHVFGPRPVGTKARPPRHFAARLDHIHRRIPGETVQLHVFGPRPVGTTARPSRHFSSRLDHIHRRLPGQTVQLHLPGPRPVGTTARFLPVSFSWNLFLERLRTRRHLLLLRRSALQLLVPFFFEVSFGGSSQLHRRFASAGHDFCLVAPGSQ